MKTTKARKCVKCGIIEITMSDKEAPLSGGVAFNCEKCAKIHRVWQRHAPLKSKNIEIVEEFILWSADWCGPCKALQGWLKNKTIEIQIRDIDNYPEAATKAAVQGLPTLDIIFEDGSTNRVVGLPDIQMTIEGFL